MTTPATLGPGLVFIGDAPPIESISAEVRFDAIRRDVLRCRYRDTRNGRIGWGAWPLPPGWDDDDVNGQIGYVESGNFSCDCNRSLTLYRGAPDADELELGCGDGTIRAALYLPDGTRVWTDDPESPERIAPGELEAIAPAVTTAGVRV